MKLNKIHMIGNAHIDPVWLWQWQEGFHEVKATFRSALDRMKEYDDFIFVASSAAFFEWVEQSDPAMFCEIQARVKEGRWVLAGGWWVEPDCNIPSGESFARHGLYAQRYFQEKFGKTARVGYAVDSFGHNGSLPQLLKKSGMPYYVFMRPMPFEKGLPGHLFWWEADDGSRVLTLRLPFEYVVWTSDVEHHVRRCAAEMKPPFDEFVCFYGVGNHGGGPTVANIESIHRLNQDPGLPELVLSTLESFFEAAEKKAWPIPVAHTDLQHHSSGCYAAHSGVKRWNREAENRLIAAEKWATLANWVTGQPYPTQFTQAWKNVLFNQFHDIMAGTSLEAAYEDARNTYGESLAIADRAHNLAVQSFAWRVKIDPVEGMRPLVVFNPLAWPVKTNIEIEAYKWLPNAFMVDEAGRFVPHQSVQSTTSTGRVRLSFNADLPALGYRTYRLYPSQPDTGETFAIPENIPCLEASDHALENDFLKLEIDPETGWIANLFDKKAGVKVFSGPAARPVVLEDDTDTWSHNVFKWDKVLGDFKATSVRLVEHGPVKSVIRVISAYGASTLTQDFAMYPDINRVDVCAVVNWNDTFKMLKLRFPVHVNFMRVTHEIPYGHIERFANGEEEPCQSWVDVSGTSRDRAVQYGFSLLNDGKYSVDVNIRDIGMTVLRSPAYANHLPSVLVPGGLYSFMDQGIHHFNYTLYPHQGNWEPAGTVQQAALLNQKPFVLFATFHPDGDLPQAQSFMQVEPANVVVSVVKQAEDGADMIVRAYETTRSSTRAIIRSSLWGGRVIEADFKPGEIKTFRVPRDPDQAIQETNLIEW